MNRGIVLSLLIVAAFFVAVSHARVATEPFHVDQASFEAWSCAGGAATCADVHKDGVKVTFKKTLKRLASMLTDVTQWTAALSGSASFVESFSSWKSLFTSGSLPSLTDIGKAIRAARKPRAGGSNTSHPYFAWIPAPQGDATPDGALLSFSTPCFGSVQATLTTVNATYVSLSVTTASQLQWFCSDAYLLVAGSTLSIQEFDEEKTYTVGFDVTKDVSTAEDQWYFQKHGVRFLRFRDNLIDTVGELVDTVSLLAGYGETNLTNATWEANLAFIRDYVQVSPRLQPVSVLRSSGATVALGIDPSYIQSGDALFVLRPDGLDPMIGWGEGDTVGHSTVAMWINGELNVCESTTLDAYWPTNGIQCHKWAEWVQLCIQAQHNVLLVPLAPAFAQKFDLNNALDFFYANEGLDYGFATFVFGWIDTAADNFPCVPTDYTTCLTGVVAQVLAVVLDRISGTSPQNIFRQALQHRVNKWPSDTSVIGTLMIAETEMNMTFTDLYQVPEKDDWEYYTTKNGAPAVGKSMVCCVFVCNIWKAAGLFGNLTDSIQCGEQTLWDIFSMQIFDSTKMGSGRPEICQQYDPSNELCQLTGEITVHLKPDLNTRPLYANMGERCPSLSPNYVRNPGC